MMFNNSLLIKWYKKAYKFDELNQSYKYLFFYITKNQSTKNRDKLNGSLKW